MRHATVLVAALVCVAAPAHAQPLDAESLTRHGLELRRQHRDAEALEEFRRAYAMSPAPRALAQIALAEQALGRWVDAEADLQKALEAHDDAWILHNARILGDGLTSIQGHLGWLEIAADAEKADITVNGAPAGELRFPARLRVVAGSVEVDIRSAGYAPARRITSVEAGGSARETVPLVPLAPPPDTATTAAVPPPPPPSASVPPPPPIATAPFVPQNRTLRNLGFVGLGAAAVGVGLGTYFGVRTLDAKSARDRECQGANPCTSSQGVTDDTNARSFAVQSTVWFVSGAVLAGAGVALLWVSRSSGHPGAASVSLELSPVLGPDRAGAVLGGAW